MPEAANRDEPDKVLSFLPTGLDLAKEIVTRLKKGGKL